jgi:hypothetical protein
MLISRNPDGPRLEIDTPPQFIWHYASAAEDPVTGDASYHLSGSFTDNTRHTRCT